MLTAGDPSSCASWMPSSLCASPSLGADGGALNLPWASRLPGLYAFPDSSHEGPVEFYTKGATVLGPGRTGLRSRNLKRNPDLVFYVERSRHIDVWRVLYGQRDIPTWVQDWDLTLPLERSSDSTLNLPRLGVVVCARPVPRRASRNSACVTCSGSPG